MTKHTFTAKVEKPMGEDGWHVVMIPPEINKKLRDEISKKGNIPVLVTIGKTTYPATTMSMGRQRWFFPIAAKIRAAEGITVDDQISVTVTPDSDRLPAK